LRRLSGIYPEYADKVAFYVVSYDTFQDMAKLAENVKGFGWTGPVAYPVGTMLRDYEVVIYSNKFAIDSKGVITYRAGPHEGTDDDFRRELKKLAAAK